MPRKKKVPPVPPPPEPVASPTPDDDAAAERSLPAWARTGVALLSKYGLGTVLTLGLVYLVAISVPSRIDKVEMRLASLDANLDRNEETTAKIAEHLRQDELQTWQLVAVAQRMCSMMAMQMGQDPMTCIITKGDPR